MVSNWRKVFIGLLFGVIFIGELSFQISTNEESSIVNLAKQEQAELDQVLERPDVKSAYQEAQARALPIQKAKDTYVTLNNRAEKSKDLFQPYSALIIDADRQLDNVWKPYNDKVDKYQTPIRETYKLRRQAGQSIVGQLSGIQYGVSASLLAAGLAFFSTLVGGSWGKILFLASFIAQATACTNIWHGAMLRYDSQIQAWGFAAMFFSCAPLAFHWGSILFEVERVIAVKAEPAVEKPKQQPVELSAQGGTLSVTDTVSHHRTVSFTMWGKNADGFLQFINFLKSEKAGGNGTGLQAEGARYFGVQSAQINRALEQARDGKKVTIPKVLALPLPAKM
jgi:hypothetical protein